LLGKGLAEPSAGRTAGRVPCAALGQLPEPGRPALGSKLFLSSSSASLFPPSSPCWHH